MTHFAKFALPLTTVYGKTQVTEGIPENLVSANAIIASNLTYDPNISSSSDTLAGGALDGNALVRISDQYAEVSFDSYIPVLGSLAGQQVGTNETAVLLINSSFNEATSSDSLVIAGITLTVKTGQTMTSAQVVDNFVKYANGLVPNNTLATYTGTLNPSYSVSAIQIGTSAIWGLFFQGILPFTGYADLTTTGSAVATIGKVTLDLTNGTTSQTNRLPIADFLECSNLFQTIITNLGLGDSLDAFYKDALGYIGEAQTFTTQGSAGIAKVRKAVQSIAALDLGDPANKVLANTLAADLLTLRNNLEGQVTLSLQTLKARINTIYTNFNAQISAQNYNLAILGLKNETDELLNLFTDWFALFGGLLAIGDKVTFAGKSYTATAITNGVELSSIIVNQGASPYASKVTIATVNPTIEARWTLTLSNSNTVRCAKIGPVATSDKTDLTAVYTKLPGSGSTMNGSLDDSLAYTIATIDDNLTTLSSQLAGLVNDNPAVNISFNELKSRATIDWNTTKPNISNVAAKVTGATLSVFSKVTNANNTVSPATFTVGDLVPVYKEVIFSNTALSPDTQTIHVRKSSADLVGLEKTVIITDAKHMVDINIENSKSPMFKFNGHGNIQDIVNSTSLVYEIAKQKTNASSITSADTIRNVSITPTGSGIYNNNVCFNKLAAPNFDGFIHDRTLTGCGNFWQATRKSHDFTVTILEERANTADIDSFNVEDALGKEFTFYFEQGLSAGNNFSITMNNCVLKGYKHTSVNATAAQDLTFECTGTSILRLF